MRVVFVGSTHFGLAALSAVNSLGDLTVVGVLTNPETFSISYSKDDVKNVLHANFSVWANLNCIPSYVMTQGMQDPQLLYWLKELKPDLLVVVGWYHMIPKSHRQLAPALGLHASLLPNYSGGAPLVWAMINGEKETGISLFEMEDGVDSGPIYGQAVTPIFELDTIETLYARIERLGIDLLKDNLVRISNGTAIKANQDETCRRTFPQRKPADGRIDWAQSKVKIYDFVRAQTRPYPGAFAYFEGKKISIWSVLKEGSVVNAAPGSITVLGDKLCISCGESGVVTVVSLSIGDKTLNVSDWVSLNKKSIFEGVKFE